MLEDAKLCSGHANKKSIDLDDIKMAIQFKLDHSYTNPPPRDVCVCTFSGGGGKQFILGSIFYLETVYLCLCVCVCQLSKVAQIICYM